MSEEDKYIETREIIEPCDRSIVAVDYELSANEKPPLVTHNGTTGLLLRYKVEGSLLDVNKTQFNQILIDNAPAHSDDNI